MRVDIFPAILLVFACVLYNNTYSAGYVWDDRAAIVSNPDVHGSGSMTDVFTHDFWGQDITAVRSHKSYRPVTTLTFRLNYSIHGINPFGYHLGNVVIYSICVISFYLLARRWITKEGSILASLYFCAHPVHVEAVASLVGRADSLCGMFTLFCLILYSDALPCMHSPRLDRALWGWFCWLISVAFALAATLSKEVGLTTFGILVVLELLYQSVYMQSSSEKSVSTKCHETAQWIQLRTTRLYHSKDSRSSTVASFNGRCWAYCRNVLAKMLEIVRSWFPYASPPYILGPAVRSAVCIACVVCTLVFRSQLHGETQMYEWTVMENNVSLLPDFKSRVLSYAQSHFLYALKLVNPLTPHLCFDYGYACLPEVMSLLAPCNLLPLTTYLLIGWFLFSSVRYCRRQAVLFLCLTIVPLIPALNILFPVGTLLAERLLFVPSIGFSLLLGELMSNDLQWIWKRLAGAGYNNIYVKAVRWIGIVTDVAKSDDEANSEQCARPDTTLTSSSSVSWSRAMMLFFLPVLSVMSYRVVSRNIDWRSEVSLYSSALDVCPTSVKALNNHGMLQLSIGRADVALEMSERAIGVYPQQVSAYINSGLASTRQHMYSRSIYRFQQAVYLSNYSSAMAYGYMGSAMYSWYRSLQNLSPHSAFLDKEGRGNGVAWGDATGMLLEKAGENLDRAFELGWTPPGMLFTRANVDIEKGSDPGLAINLLRRAILDNRRLKDMAGEGAPAQDMIDESSACNQLGLALWRAERAVEAEEAFLQGIAADPNRYEILVNLGSMYRAVGDIKGAGASFSKAMALFSKGTAPAALLHNAGLVEQDLGRLDAAIELFSGALRALESEGGQYHPHYVTMKNNLERAIRSKN